MKNFSETIRLWYRAHQRDLPWRHTSDPYAIWLSEVILQQTQVAQGMAYYYKFLEHYPRITDLAAAPEDEVMKHWQGLGYYSRARNLQAAAQMVAHTYKGKFPTTYEDIRALKGVGDYTAAAIASLAFGLPHAVVDGNVYRVLARVFGIDTPIDSTAGKKEFQQLADELLDPKHAAEHNQAMMEFGATWCRPVNPNCEACPFRETCAAFREKRIDRLPVKAKKTKVRPRYFHYFVISYKDKIYLRKRQEKDIWQNLYEFCLLESDTPLKPEALIQDAVTLQLPLGFKTEEATILHISKDYKHILSHQHLHTRFIRVQLRHAPKKGEGFLAVSKEEVKDYAWPRLLDKYLQDYPLR